MNAKNELIKIINLSNEDLVYDLLKYALENIKNKNGMSTNELLNASESSLSFWDNDIDDKVWNNA